MIQVINQRQIYLENLKRKTREFWQKVVDDYNRGLSAAEIANNYINKRTGKPYSRQHIHAIIKTMRES